MLNSLLAGKCCSNCEIPGWSYDGPTGPSTWPGQTGQNQSPIDLCNEHAKGQPDVISFDYQPVVLDLFNNGRTIQVNAGGHFQLNHEPFKLLQFHFHTPSEHAIKGIRHPLEMHLVHQHADCRLAVVGVFFVEGEANAELEKIWNCIPPEGKQYQTKDVLINPARLLPTNLTRYQYYGSLTMPPCTEGVLWTVLDEPLTVSSEQIKAFQSLFSFDNARDLQKTNGRVIRHGR